MREFTTRSLLLLVIAALGIMPACSDDDGDSGGTAMVRAVHAAAGDSSPTVDIWVDGDAPEEGSPLDNLSYKDATPYIELSSGTHEIAVVQDGETLESSSGVFFVQEVDLEEDTQTTVFAYGLGTGDGVDIGSYSQAMPEEGTTPTAADVRVVHAADGLGNVDIVLDGDTRPVTGLAPGTASAVNQLNTGTDYVVGIAEADAENTTVDYDVNLADAGDYAVFAAGTTTELNSLVLLAVDSEGNVIEISPVDYSYLRVFHAANAGSVDVYVESTDGGSAESPLASGLERLAAAGGDFNGYVRLRSGQFDVDVTAAGETDPVLEASSVMLSPGERYTAFAFGDPSDDEASGIGLLNDDPSEDLSVGIAQASSEANPPIIYVDGEEVSDSSGAAAGSTFTSTDVESGYVRFGISDASLRNPEEQFTFFIDSGVTNLFLVGETDNTTYPLQMAALASDNTVRVADPDAQVRLLHVASTIDSEEADEPVDVYYDNIMLADDLELLDGTSYISVPAGVRTLEFYPGSTSDIESTEPTLSVEQQFASLNRYTAVTSDTSDFDPQPIATVINDLSRSELPTNITATSSGLTALQVVHVNQNRDAQLLSLYEQAGSADLPLVTDLGYRSADYAREGSGELSALQAQTFDLLSDLDEDDTPDLLFEDIDLGPSEGDTATVFHILDGNLNTILLLNINGDTQVGDGAAAN